MRPRHVYAIMVVVSALICVGAVTALVWAVLMYMPADNVQYSAPVVNKAVLTAASVVTIASTSVPVVVHIATPKSVKAVYYTSWAAGNNKFRKELFDLIDTTEVNAVVIDVKDYTGRISFAVTDPTLVATGAAEERIPDIRNFISKLHSKGVYVIGRISSFQDSFLIKSHPEWAVHTGQGVVWQDYKGVKWLDAGAEPVWDYLAAIGKEAYAAGFDELNFDYVRYPSDGNLKDIVYSWSAGRTREEVMKAFFAGLKKRFEGTPIVLSADLFGLTTSAEDDMGIGQILTDALPYFDFVAPMVYPSHFATGYIGYVKPAEHPYEVIKFSMGSAIARAEATTTRVKLFGDELIASTSPKLYTKVAVDRNKLRPWLQAFDLGAIYGPDKVRAQIQATYDLGLSSWMLWNAASVYGKDNFMPVGTSFSSTKNQVIP